MNYILDVHCHTVLSGHAYSTVSENAAHAAKIGLTHIGVSDHAPGMPGAAHLYAFSNLWSLPDEINGVRVLKGVECNIMTPAGELDLDPKLLAKMDFAIASFHRGTFPPKNKKIHTQALIHAMENNPDMHILGHPGCKFFDIDTEAVIAAAARTHTIIEINNQSLHPGSYRFHGDSKFLEILTLCKQHKVPVLASSDAHFCTMVGDLTLARAVIEKANMPEELILNTCAEKFLAAIKKKKDRGGVAPASPTRF
jgi:putative hydrolase